MIKLVNNYPVSQLFESEADMVCATVSKDKELFIKGIKKLSILATFIL
jgi:hypothetical protein